MVNTMIPERVSALRELWRMVWSVTLVLCSIAVVLSLLNRVPGLLQQPERTRYATVEQAETELGTRIGLPAYFPEFLGWPPAEISVTRNDALIVTLMFTLRQSGETGLVACQILRNKEEEAPDLPFAQPERPMRETHVAIGNATATLLIGTNRIGQRWSRLSWHARDRDMILMANFDDGTLLTMARSIH